MGTFWSSYMSKRREKAAFKRLTFFDRKLKKRLEEAEEYIDLLQEQRHLVKDLHAQNRIFPDSMPVTWRAYIDSTTAQMEEEIRALKRKSKIGEIGLKAAEQRCHLLERHVRYLKNKEASLQNENSTGRRRLSKLILKQEACQFSQLQNTLPLDNTSASLPNLHFTEL